LGEDFYRAFEDRYRGSRESIKDRLSLYIPFVSPLVDIYPDAKALDIGCGRGEWLELLEQSGIDAHGVDSDSGMLQACEEIGLSVELGDGIELLSREPDESMIVISAFHVVEHISFGELDRLYKEAFRVLKRGGVLILETPNVENIRVGAEKFYLDPTHSHPIPSMLLSFMAEYHHFGRVKTLGLNHSKTLLQLPSISIWNVIEDVSPDYAIVAQKGASEEILSKLDEPFGREYGVSFQELAQRFEDRISSMESRVDSAISSATRAIDEAQQARDIAQEARSSYQALIESSSWRVTKPLRYISDRARWFATGARSWLTLAKGSRPHRIATKISDTIERSTTTMSYEEKILKIKDSVERRLNSYGKK